MNAPSLRRAVLTTLVACGRGGEPDVAVEREVVQPLLAGCSELSNGVCTRAPPGNPAACEPTLPMPDESATGMRLAIWYPRAASVSVRVDDDAERGAQSVIDFEEFDDGIRIDLAIDDDARTLTLLDGETVAGAWSIADAPAESPALVAARAALRLATEDPALATAYAALAAEISEYDPRTRLRAHDVLADLEFQRAYMASERAPTWNEVLSRSASAYDLGRDVGDLDRASCHAHRAMHVVLAGLGDAKERERWRERFDDVSAQLPDDRLSFAHNAYARAIAAERAGDLQRAAERYSDAFRLADRWGDAGLALLARSASTSVLATLGREVEANAMLAEANQRAARRRCIDWVRVLNAEGWAHFMMSELGRRLGDPIDSLETALLMTTAPGDPNSPTCVDNALLTHVRLNLAIASVAEGWVGYAESLRHVLPAAEYLDPYAAFWLEELDQRLVLARDEAGELTEWLMRVPAPDAPTPEHEHLRRYGRGLAFERLGLIHDALEEYEKADAALGEMVSRLDFDGGRDRLLVGRQLSSGRRVALLLARGEVDRAMCIARLARARTNVVLDRSARISAMNDDERRAWETALADHERLRAESESLRTKAWTVPLQDRAEAAALVTEIDGRRRAASLRAAAMLSAPDPFVTEAERCADLRPPGGGELLLLVFPTDASRWIVFAATTAGIASAGIERLPAEDAELGEWSAALLSPFSAEIAAATSLRVMPTGVVWTVPFAALPFDDDVLLAQVPVANSMDLGAASSAAPRRSALVVADPLGDLVHASAEATLVAETLRERGWNVLSLEGRGATLEQVARQLAEVDLVHYAGHGGDAGIDGWRSRLRLAEGASLTVADILALHRAPSLAVLPSCETGPSPEGGRAGAMNVSRAFLLAGSEFVVGAVGEVDDELSLALTRRFYAALESGAEPLSALRTAVLAVRADEHIDADVRAQWHRVRAFVR